MCCYEECEVEMEEKKKLLRQKLRYDMRLRHRTDHAFGPGGGADGAWKQPAPFEGLQMHADGVLEG